MGQYYKPKNTEGDAYVKKTKAFVSCAKHVVLKLPKKYYELYIKGIIEAVSQIEENVVKSNAVYFNYNDNKELAEAYTQRISYLLEALRAYYLFEARFDELMILLDDVNSEGYRLAKLIAKDQDIDVSFNPSDMTYTAVSGDIKTKLQLTAHTQEVLAKRTYEMSEELKKRLGLDRKKLKELQATA